MRYIYFPDLDERAFLFTPLLKRSYWILNEDLNRVYRRYYLLEDSEQEHVPISHTFVGSQIHYIYPKPNWVALYPTTTKDKSMSNDMGLKGSAVSLLLTMIDHGLSPILAAVSITLIEDGHLNQVLSDYLVRYYMVMALNWWSGYHYSDLDLILTITFYSPTEPLIHSTTDKRGSHTLKQYREHVNKVVINGTTLYSNYGVAGNISQIELRALEHKYK